MQEKIVILTGARISVESGINTFHRHQQGRATELVPAQVSALIAA